MQDDKVTMSLKEIKTLLPPVSQIYFATGFASIKLSWVCSKYSVAPRSAKDTRNTIRGSIRNQYRLICVPIKKRGHISDPGY